MVTLATNTPRAYELGDENDLPVVAADIIYEGAAVGDNASGYARPLVAGDAFRGFADAPADNSAGAAGAVSVHVRQKGRVQLAIASLAITDVGKPVYASDDNTFTLTKGSNSLIGKVIRYVESGVGIVEFKATPLVITIPAAATGGDAPTEAEYNNLRTAVSELAAAIR